MRLEPDDWTSWYAVVPATLRTMRGVEHPLPPARQNAPRVSFWELTPDLGGEEAFEAVALCATYYARELGKDVPFHARTGAKRADRVCWLWTTGARTGGVRALGACAVRREDRASVTPVMVLDFVWLHPYARHQGMWTAAFAILLRRYERLAVDALTINMRYFLHGKPRHALTTMSGESLHVYTAEPWCATHGPMVQSGPNSWWCGAKKEDGTHCRNSYPAPAPARR